MLEKLLGFWVRDKNKSGIEDKSRIYVIRP